MKQILYFSGKFCAPCSSFKPTIDSISQRVGVNYIDVDDNPSIVAEYGVRSVPTLIFLKDNRMVEKRSGVMSEQQIMQIYNSL
jgi:thioredoxin-like negative regulator of GroEL